MRYLSIFFLLLTFILGQDPTLSIQGVLRQPSGKAVADGTYSITFNFYNSATGGSIITKTAASGGGPASVTENVLVKDGLYTANINITGIPFNEQYWVAVKIGSDPELSPRAKLTAAPYALALQGLKNKFPSTGSVIAGDSLLVMGSIKVSGTFESDGDIQINGNITTAGKQTIVGELDVVDTVRVTKGLKMNNGNIDVVSGSYTMSGKRALDESSDGAGTKLVLNAAEGFTKVEVSSPVSIMGESPFRILWGTVNSDGSFFNNGSGFTVTANPTPAGDNSYTVVFNKPFSSPPTIQITPYWTTGAGGMSKTYSVTTTTAIIHMTQNSGGRSLMNGFNIIIIGF